VLSNNSGGGNGDTLWGKDKEASKGEVLRESLIID